MKLQTLLNQIEELDHIHQEMPQRNEMEKLKKTQYYDQQILPLIRQKFREFEHQKLKKKYDYLILSVGQSVYPLILSIEAVQAKQVIFLHSVETEKNIDRIVIELQMLPSQFQKVKVDSVELTTIYRELFRIIELNPEAQIIADFTGGTKAMSGGLAMAAATINLDLMYIGSVWNNKERRPKPGSEYVELLNNPYEVFGDLEDARAKGFWDAGQFLVAAEIYESLYQRLPEQYKFKVLSTMAKAYDAWESFDVIEAYDQLAWVARKGFKHLDRMNIRLFTHEKKNLIIQQVDILESLSKHMSAFQQSDEKNYLSIEILANEQVMERFILTFYTNGLRKQKQQHYDYASLYYYRMIEVILQHRLALHGVHASDPDYSSLNMDEKEILEKLNALLKKYDHGKLTRLPTKIALAHAHLLLALLDDPIVKRVHHKRLVNEVQLRNLSILAHGYKQIDLNRLKKLKEITDIFLEDWFKVNQLDERVLELYNLSR